MMLEITRPERVLYFLLPGRLVGGENGKIEIWLQLKYLNPSFIYYYMWENIIIFIIQRE